MTQEEKAKAYDEVLNKLRYFIAKGVDPLITRADVQDFFPELLESEEERIRKEIIELVMQPTWKTEKEFNRRNELCEWLEKQGKTSPILSNSSNIGKVEQKPAFEMKTPEESLGIDPDTYNKIVDECIYGEQKPDDKVEPKFKVKYAGSEYNVLEVKDIYGVTYYGIEDEPNHIDYVQAENCERVGGYSIKENGSPYPTKPAKFSEQNPAWSEEDEKQARQIERIVHNDGCSKKLQE